MRRRQLDLRFHRRGGKRLRAGRKRRSEDAGITHHGRERFRRLLPVHVTVRMAAHVYNLRSERAFSVVGRAIAHAAQRFGVTIVEFSVQGNHVHLVVEAPEDAALSQAMQGFGIRVAKGLNRMMNRSGRVFADRYHAHVLRTPPEARIAIAYVRDNYRRHMAQLGQTIGASFVDTYSTKGGRLPLPQPTSWLLKTSRPP
jgi:REP element-mobilizing transposase RayT